MNEASDVKKPDAGACGSGCGCGTTAPNIRGRKVVGIVVLAVVCALVGWAIVKNQSSASEPQASTGFAGITVAEPAPVAKPEPVSKPSTEQAVKTESDEASAEQEVTSALQEIGALMELNQLAMDAKGVFIYVAAQGPSAAKVPLDSMLGAARKIEPQAGGKIGMFTLKEGSPDYEMIAAQVDLPGVLVMVPGGRMVPVTDEITETKLIHGFLSSVQSCGVGGCGPRR